MPFPDALLRDKKSLLRQEMQALRLGKSAKNPSNANLLRDHFIRHVSLEAGAVIAGYRAFRGEIDPGPLIDALRARGHKIALPVVGEKGGVLKFYLHEANGPLAVNAMGIEQPFPDTPVAEPDLVLAPLLAFDRLRNRLGYGGGFYDRAIAELRRRKPVVAVGIAYGFQEVASVPVGDNDVRLDIIVTEDKIF